MTRIGSFQNELSANEQFSADSVDIAVVPKSEDRCLVLFKRHATSLYMAIKALSGTLPAPNPLGYPALTVAATKDATLKLLMDNTEDPKIVTF